ncbi:MAG: tRNA-dihydrouridine synthase family protein [Bacteroidales bacterium]|nr:tRNA-dihydrouridine synthase family protein [Bacteroidales bacterium]
MKIYFAPFHGLGCRQFRLVFMKHFGGFDAVFLPFIPAQQLHQLKQTAMRDIFPKENTCEIIPQIIGNDINAIVDTTCFLYDLGFEKVNLNLGCPMPKITRKRRACGLMPFAEEIEQIVDRVCETSPVKFSLKMRLGMFSAEESIAILNRVNNYPLDEVIIHARLGVQQYEGKVDRQAFQTCYQVCRLPLCYNGDVFTKEDFCSVIQQFPNLRAVMLGRGMLQNPFLLEEIKGNMISAEEKNKRFVAFYQDLISAYQQYFPCQTIIVNRLKELWKYFYHFVPLSDDGLQQLLRQQGDEFLSATCQLAEKSFI